MKKQVQGIRSVKNIEDFSGFDSEQVVRTIEENKDIILKVEPYKPHDSFEDAIDVYLNLKAEKTRLVDGILNIFNKFEATSVNLEYNKTRGTTHGIRILRFWWDRHDRLRNI